MNSTPVTLLFSMSAMTPSPPNWKLPAVMPLRSNPFTWFPSIWALAPRVFGPTTMPRYPPLTAFWSIVAWTFPVALAVGALPTQMPAETFIGSLYPS